MTFIDVLNEYHIPYITSGHHHARPGWVQLDCPWCGAGSQKYHLGYNIAHGYANCWRCGPHGVVDTIVAATGLTYGAARAALGPLTLDRDRRATRPPGRLTVPTGLGPLTRAHRDYLSGRGFDPAELERLWGLRGIGVAARLGWRVWVPVHYRGAIVSWTTRAIGSNPARYISAGPAEEALPHKDLLYGEDYARHAIIVCEGPADVWRIGPGAVATFGTGVSTAQMLKISRYPTRVLCFDMEREAQRQQWKLQQDLRVFPGRTAIVKLESADPGCATDEEVAELRRAWLGSEGVSSDAAMAAGRP
jgi:hypothetical protein